MLSLLVMCCCILVSCVFLSSFIKMVAGHLICLLLSLSIDAAPLIAYVNHYQNTYVVLPSMYHVLGLMTSWVGGLWCLVFLPSPFSLVLLVLSFDLTLWSPILFVWILIHSRLSMTVNISAESDWWSWKVARQTDWHLSFESQYASMLSHLSHFLFATSGSDHCTFLLIFLLYILVSLDLMNLISIVDDMQLKEILHNN